LESEQQVVVPSQHTAIPDVPMQQLFVPVGPQITDPCAVGQQTLVVAA
jgi:hypothetical protein